MTDYVLNAASLHPSFDNINDARAELAELLRGLAILDSGASPLPVLRVGQNPWLTEVVHDGLTAISLGEVAQQLFQVGEHEAADYFLSLSMMSPIDGDADTGTIEDLLSVEMKRPANTHVPCFERAVQAGSDAIYCAVSDGLLISFSRAGLWDIDHLAFGTDAGDLVVDHAANCETANRVAQKRARIMRVDLTSRSFWEVREKAFPALNFGLDVEDQIRSVDTRVLALVFSRLEELNNRVQRWREVGVFPDGVPIITGETAATMAQYGNQRRFRNHVGTRETFEEHMWVDRLFRIHLLRTHEDQSVCVGYIGRHLSTISFPT